MAFTADELLARMFASMREWVRAQGAAAGVGEVLELPGVVACVVPEMPRFSVFNSVVYETAQQLGAALDELAARYEQAGVGAWTVWSHEQDAGAAVLLQKAGHVLDAQPMSMGLELSGLEPAEHELDVLGDPDLGTVDGVLSLSYGFERGHFARAFPRLPEMSWHVARADGEPAVVLATIDCGGDCGVYYVGTAPAARGRGLARELLRRALLEARERGCETSTLQSTRMGHPVYARLGYRDLGPVFMWERRRADVPSVALGG